MPRTINYRPYLIEGLITIDRIDSYTNVFKPADDVQLMGTYLWNSHVCGAFYPILSSAEVILRNAIDQRLTEQLGRFWWGAGKLNYKSYVEGEEPPESVNIVKSNFERASTKVIREHDKRYGKGARTLKHADVVAATDFSTWQFLLDAQFMGNGLIWPSNLGRVFRGAGSMGQRRLRLHAYDLVNGVRNFRNRVFHHEPAWKHSSVKNEDDAVEYLHDRLGKLEELISLIEPEKTRFLRSHGILKTAKRVCSITELRRFQLSDEAKRLKSLGKLSKITDACHESNQAVRVRFYRGRYGSFLLIPG